jgi:hypothetical protein
MKIVIIGCVFRGKPNSIPGSARKCSASARNPVRLHPGMLFGFSPESCSTCPGMLFGFAGIRRI